MDPRTRTNRIDTLQVYFGSTEAGFARILVRESTQNFALEGLCYKNQTDTFYLTSRHGDNLTQYQIKDGVALAYSRNVTSPSTVMSKWDVTHSNFPLVVGYQYGKTNVSSVLWLAVPGISGNEVIFYMGPAVVTAPYLQLIPVLVLGGILIPSVALYRSQGRRRWLVSTARRLKQGTVLGVADLTKPYERYLVPWRYQVLIIATGLITLNVALVMPFLTESLGSVLMIPFVILHELSGQEALAGVFVSAAAVLLPLSGLGQSSSAWLSRCQRLLIVLFGLTLVVYGILGGLNIAVTLLILSAIVYLLLIVVGGVPLLMTEIAVKIICDDLPDTAQ